jgi:serine/threonine-protein kinase
MATAKPDRCPSCHAERPANAPAGLCPRCLLRNGLASEALSLYRAGEVGATIDLSGPPSILETLADSVGPVPRILLRDTDTGSEPPVHRPSSPEMPATADRAARLRLLGEIARGGMGAVLKGRDEDLGRDLAIKVLLERHRDDPDLVRRFIEEAQIGGQLQHPGIVPIYELGTFADRRPYFAMKLVKGQTLAALLAGRSAPREGLPTFLGIFEQICQTVAYAHARGVIHRDLKPSNVMVGGFGEVQVMDWGLAKVLPRGGAADDAAAGRHPDQDTVIATARSDGDSAVALSRAGSVLGTPSYMAPEQARGEVHEVDERADVFALGSILAEVLTGSPGFTGRSSAEIQRKAARADTADALARLEASGADAELVALARACLAAEPSNRPRDAGAVRDRVTAYLSGVQERLRAAEIDRARAEARAAEERRRRRLQLGLAASLLALTTLGGLAFTYELQRRQAHVARIDRLLAEATLLRNQASAQPEVVYHWTRAREAVARIADELGPSAPARLAALRLEVEAGLGAAESDRDLLARLVDIRSAQADDLDGSATDAAYADAFGVAGIAPDGGNPAEAGAQVARRPPPVAAALVAALDHWAGIRRRRDATGQGCAPVLAAARAADRDPDRDALRAALLVEEKAQRLGRLRPLADHARAGSWTPTSLVLLGDALASAGDVDAGIAVLQLASWSHPGDAGAHYALAQLLDGARPPRPEEAIRAYSIAWGLQPELAGHTLAHLLERRGRGAEAESVWRDLVGRRPGNGHHLGCYGQYLKERGRVAEAAPVLAQAVAALREAIRRRPNDADVHNNFGLALRAAGDVTGAVATLREAIRLMPNHAGAHTNLGNALRDSGDLPGAIAAYREAIRLRPDLADAQCYLGFALRASGDVPGAVAALRKAIRLRPGYAEPHSDLGLALRASGDVPGAVATLREAIRLRPDYAQAHTNLGNALGDAGDVPGAVTAYREAIRLRPDLSEAHFNLGLALIRSGNVSGAVAAYREVIRLKPDDAEAHCNLGHALRQEGRYAEALAELRLGHQLGSKRAGWRYPSAQWVAQVERLSALADRFRAVLASTAEPADNGERLVFAQMAYDTQQFAGAARLWAEALNSDPKLADDRQAQHRYNAACAAALAAGGTSRDDPPPDEAAQAGFRTNSLAWLKAECDAWTQLLEADPKARPRVAPILKHWQTDPNLASLRDPSALAKLPEAERKDWHALWADVGALIERAREQAP